MITNENRLSFVMLGEVVLLLFFFGIFISHNQNLKKFFQHLEYEKKKVHFYKLNQFIELKNSSADKFLCKGWSVSEGTHRWTDGKIAEIILKNRKFINKNLIFKIQMSGLVTNEIPYQDVRVYINNSYLNTWKVSDYNWYQLEIPATLAKTDILEIKFLINTAVSPIKINGSNDTRLLGLMTDQFVIEENLKKCSYSYKYLLAWM